jgi:hypothetical protein
MSALTSFPRRTASRAAWRPIELSRKKTKTGLNAYQTHRPKRSQKAKKTLKNSNKLGSMEAKWYRARKCYRVWVPARLSETGKNCRRFFETKEQAQKFIFETKRSGSIELAELAVEEKHVLGVIRQSEKYEPKLLLEAWRRFESEEPAKW